MHAADWAMTVLLSLAPVSELRGGLPYAMARGADPYAAAVVAVLANLSVIPVLLYGLKHVEPRLRRCRRLATSLDAVFDRTRRKGRMFERLGDVGLVFLVALPLPGTGAWTGAILAYLLGVPTRRAVPLVGLGVLIAGLLVLLAGLGVLRVFGLG